MEWRGRSSVDAAGPFAAGAFFGRAVRAADFLPPDFPGVNLVAMAHPLSASPGQTLPAIPSSAIRRPAQSKDAGFPPRGG